MAAAKPPKAPTLNTNKKGDLHVGNMVCKKIPTSVTGYKNRKCDLCKNPFEGGAEVLEIKKQFKGYYTSTTGSVVMHKSCMEFFLWPDEDMEQVKLSFKTKREQKIQEDWEAIRQQYLEGQAEL